MDTREVVGVGPSRGRTSRGTPTVSYTLRLRRVDDVTVTRLGTLPVVRPAGRGAPARHGGRAPGSSPRRSSSSRARARAPDGESDESEPPLGRPSRTTHGIVASARGATDPKYTCSVRELTRWLQELADAGILERHGDDWRPTPVGELWLRPIAEAFPPEAEAVAV